MRECNVILQKAGRAVMNAFLVLTRWWSWWDAVVLDKHHILVAVQVSEWPFPWELLRWLFCGSGATDLVEEPDSDIGLDTVR